MSHPLRDLARIVADSLVTAIEAQFLLSDQSNQAVQETLGLSPSVFLTLLRRSGELRRIVFEAPTLVRITPSYAMQGPPGFRASFELVTTALSMRALELRVLFVGGTRCEQVYFTRVPRSPTS